MLKDFNTYTCLPAEDLERARAFYSEQLGLEVEQDVEDDGTFYKSGRSRLYVFKSTGRSSGSHTQLAWTVKDIEKEVGELKSRQVQFEEYDLPTFKTENSIATTSQVRAAWFRDSEGNLLGLRQLVEQSPAVAGSDGAQRGRTR